jgi:hypothetical protein
MRSILEVDVVVVLVDAAAVDLVAAVVVIVVDSAVVEMVEVSVEEEVEAEAHLEEAVVVEVVEVDSVVVAVVVVHLEAVAVEAEVSVAEEEVEEVSAEVAVVAVDLAKEEEAAVPDSLLVSAPTAILSPLALPDSAPTVCRCLRARAFRALAPTACRCPSARRDSAPTACPCRHPARAWVRTVFRSDAVPSRSAAARRHLCASRCNRKKQLLELEVQTLQQRLRRIPMARRLPRRCPRFTPRRQRRSRR